MDSRGIDGNVPENTPRRYTPDDPDVGAAARRAGEKVQQKKRSHLVIGESALLIADYFDRVGSLKISR